MPEFDFAILHMLNRNRRGLTAKKYFLDRLAPIFFSPRVEHLIHFGDLGFRGCNIFVPLGMENWQQLAPVQRDYMWKKSEHIMQGFAVGGLAADRRLKDAMQNVETRFPLAFGDNFIQALAAVLVEHTLSKRAINKLILVGAMTELIPLLDYLGGCGVPISVQNQHPTGDEALAWRLLYEKGWAVSHGYISPEKWQRGDLVVLFQPGYRRLALAAPGTFWLELSDEGHNLAPSLENDLLRAGLDHGLPMLAPILESILFTKAGILDNNLEFKSFDSVSVVVMPEIKDGKDLADLITAGEQLGLWEPFRCGEG